MGSGGMVVMDESTCMVGMAKFFLDFTAKESCGKCIHCRIGTKRMLEMLERITKGEGKEGDIELLEELCYSIKDGALCGLGQTAPNGCTLCARNCPVNAISGTVKNPHVINTEKCIKCGKCYSSCRFGAIVKE